MDTQAAYWESKVAVLPFATPVHLKQATEQLNAWISDLNLEQTSSNNNSTLKLARYKSKNEDISLAIQNDNTKELDVLMKEGTRVSF